MSDRSDWHPDDSLLQGILDGELEAQARADLEDHLENCAECAQSLADLRAAIAALESLPDLPLARDLSRDVVAALRAYPARPSRPRSLAWLGVAEGVVALAILAWAWPRTALTFATLPMVPWRELLDAVRSVLSPGLNVPGLAPDSLLRPFVDLRGAVEGLPLGVGQAGALLVFATLAWLAGNAVVLRRVPVNDHGDGLT